MTIPRLSSLLLLLPALTVAHRDVFDRHLHARQAAASSSAASSHATTSVASATASVPAASSVPAAGSAPGTSSVPAGASIPVAPGASSAATSGTGSVLPDSTLTATDPNIPPLSAITSGMPSTMATVPLPTTASLGQAGPFPGFPNLPTTTLTQSAYPVPTGTVVAFADDKVKQWLQELEGHNIPDIPPTNPPGEQGACAANPDAVADKTRCWWTCGGCTRDTDVFTCPDKQTWGLTFDDGPSPQTPRLLSYLEANQLKSTFAVVGGSNYYYSDVLRAEYVAGHHIIVHTYRHPYMTSLTTPEVVAELGYTRDIIRDTIGVTPAYWRPPYGDVDDRVRAIAYAMGMQTIIWTRNPATLDQFDTNDWRIPAGQVTGPQAFQQFQNILANASNLNTGFIVLEHDLYQETVDLAVGYTLPSALNHNPKFNIMPVIDCLKLEPSEAYIETMKNKNRPAPETNWTGGFIQDPASLLDGNNTSASGGTSSGAKGQSSSGKSGALTTTVSLGTMVMGLAVAALF